MVARRVEQEVMTMIKTVRAQQFGPGLRFVIRADAPAEEGAA
ncbi:MAG: hypothetical protein ABIZ57_01380 [Candidatus Limnocylindria bacterium]